MLIIKLYAIIKKRSYTIILLQKESLIAVLLQSTIFDKYEKLQKMCLTSYNIP